MFTQGFFSPVAVNEARERSTLEDRFRHSRPEILETLRMSDICSIDREEAQSSPYFYRSKWLRGPGIRTG